MKFLIKFNFREKGAEKPVSKYSINPPLPTIIVQKKGFYYLNHIKLFHFVLIKFSFILSSSYSLSSLKTWNKNEIISYFNSTREQLTCIIQWFSLYFTLVRTSIVIVEWKNSTYSSYSCKVIQFSLCLLDLFQNVWYDFSYIPYLDI